MLYGNVTDGYQSMDILHCKVDGKQVDHLRVKADFHYLPRKSGAVGAERRII